MMSEARGGREIRQGGTGEEREERWEGGRERKGEREGLVGWVEERGKKVRE